MTDTIRYWLALLRWHLRGPYRYGDPLLGAGWMREQNRRLLRERWLANKPQPPKRGSVTEGRDPGGEA
jgi:hypothetical protein